MKKIHIDKQKKQGIFPIAYSNKKINNYRTIVTTKQANAIVEQASDLISNPDFRPYFFKTLYLIGPEKFYEAMDMAKKAVDPNCRPCLFVNKLKEFREAISND